MDLTPTDCRFILPDASYCAEPKAVGAYCAHHSKLCYVPASARAKQVARSPVSIPLVAHAL